MSKCWLFHKWEEVNIKETVKTIGKRLGQWEEGIYKRVIITTTAYKCERCGTEKEEQNTKEETIRQYYR